MELFQRLKLVLIKGESQIWRLFKIKNHLYLGHNKGFYFKIKNLII